MRCLPGQTHTDLAGHERVTGGCRRLRCRDRRGRRDLSPLHVRGRRGAVSTDTVYGLATEPESKEGVRRLYGLKGRVPDKPAAVMFFDLELALAALPELGPRTAAALAGCCPPR